MSALGVAMDARRLLAAGWTQPTGPTRAELCRARTATGEICGHLSPKAATWTLSGAVLKACDDDGGDHARDPRAVELFAVLKRQLGEEPSAYANSAGRWQADVLAALDAAIAELKRRGE